MAGAAADSSSSAVMQDELIPIRLDLDVDGNTVTDYFTWSPDSSISPTEFAAQLAGDLDLPAHAVGAIAASISDQLADAADARAERDALAANRPRSGGVGEGGERAGAAEARQVVKLNVRVGRVVLKDQFEWDMSAGDNNPEAFAEILSADLGLCREFVPAIAHGVREQLIVASQFRRRRAGCAMLNGRTAIRAPSSINAFQPVVECLSAAQQDTIEKREKREARLNKRSRDPPAVVSKPTGRGKRRYSMDVM